VPTIVRRHVPGAVDAFLGDHGLSRADIANWVLHTGGPQVIDGAANVATSYPGFACTLARLGATIRTER